MKRALVGIAVAATCLLSACGTKAEQEIKEIDGHKFLCTWTHKPGDPYGKDNYRCEVYEG